MKETESPLHLQAKRYLLETIKAMEPGNNKLESENALASRLGMSRETIRKAMTALIEEGCITRKHGKGNFGHPTIANLSMRIDKNSDFRRLLEAKGHEVHTYRSPARRDEPSEGMLRRMNEAAGTRVVLFEIEFFADGQSAIRGRVELPESTVKSFPEAGEYVENIGSVFRNHCTAESNHTTAWLIAERAPEEALPFGLDPETPLLSWEELYYDLQERPVGYVKIWFNPRVMNLSLLLTF